MTSKKCRYNHEDSNDVCKLEGVYLKKIILAYYKIVYFLLSFDLYRSAFVSVDCSSSF